MRTRVVVGIGLMLLVAGLALPVRAQLPLPPPSRPARR